jgi:hypothetical protein
MSLQAKLSLHLKRLFGKSECSTESVFMMVDACGYKDKIFEELSLKKRKERRLYPIKEKSV